MTRKLLSSAAVLSVVAALAGATTFSAWSVSSTNPGNSFSSGTVALSDNDPSSAVVSLSNARPNDSSTGCIRATYTGSLDADVKLYANVSGALAPYLDVTITRGTDAAPAFPSCAGFSAGPVLYSGSLSSLPSNWAAGIADGPAWTTGSARSYRIVVTQQSNPAAQGLNGSATFTWEARNQ